MDHRGDANIWPNLRARVRENLKGDAEMNHGDGGGWKMWIPMILCCAAMFAVFALFGLGAWSLR